MAKRGRDFQLTKEQQKLAEANLNLARDQAWRYFRSTNIEYSILESAAFEGLCQAAAKYDATLINEDTGRSMRFSSLAVPYIRGSILHYIRDKTYAMRLTHRMREIWVKGRKMLHKGYTDIEIFNTLKEQYKDFTLKEWQDTKSACSGPPLELGDHAMPSAPLEPDEVDMLTPFREEAAELLGLMPDMTRARMEKFAHAHSNALPRLLQNDLDKLLKAR